MAQPKKQRAPMEPRKMPMQARSIRTVELMFEAATQIIKADGIAAVTTNRLAMECGISVGSLYQYFPNKHALLLAMAEKEMRRIAQQLRAAFDESTARDGANLELAIATALLGSLSQRHRVRRELCEYAIQSGRADIVRIPILEAYTLLTARENFAMSPLRAFVLASAIQGVMRAAAAEDGTWLKDRDLPVELAKLAKFYRSAA
jgi:AcrR family transcriptional regulator